MGLRSILMPALCGIAAVSAAAIFAATSAEADQLRPGLGGLAARYSPFTRIAGQTQRFAYGSHRGTLHLLESRRAGDGRRELVERAARELWTPVLRVLAADLDRDAQDEIIVTTQDARIFVLDGTTLADIWSTPPERYVCINALTVGDVDGDGEPEIVFIADGLLRISAGMQDTDEWRPDYAQCSCFTTDLEMGDLDGDGRDEIVLALGRVLAPPFLHVAWEYEDGFGVEVDLHDIDGDGKLEILGRDPDGLIQVFDPDVRRLKWE